MRSSTVGGYKANAFIVFDYWGPEDFKYAGINVSTDKIEIGQRTAGGWQVLDSGNSQIKAGADVNLLLAINGTTATIVIDNAQSLSYSLAPRIDAYGITHNLRDGMVGLGAQNAKARIDNVVLQVLPPAITYTVTDAFTAAPTLVTAQTGAWTSAGGLLCGAPAAGQTMALAVGELGVVPSSLLQLETKIGASAGAISGVVFDFYAADDFKFAAVDRASGQWC